MKTAGIDIGTTTICAVVLENGNELNCLTEKNDSFIKPRFAGEKLQDPDKILVAVIAIVEQLFHKYPDIKSIGITGQMHGILYLDQSGNAVSPLYTWQDERGDLICPESETGETWACYLRRKTGSFVSTGYGLLTHAVNQDMNIRDPEGGWVSASAVTCCTIGDYVAMKLCGLAQPALDVSNAAGLGFFDVRKGWFDKDAVTAAGIDISFLPKIAGSGPLGTYEGKAKVMPAIGDNQASFIGTMQGRDYAMLVNVGTGSQFSVFTESYMEVDRMETRPMPGGGYLLTGAALCGGRAYALLEYFFRLTAEMLGMEKDQCYKDMEMLLKTQPQPEQIPKVLPYFQGTRWDTSLTGCITDLTTDNFTPLHLIWGMMEGMAEELHQMYLLYIEAGGERKPLFGSGNGLRKNTFLQKCFEKVFGDALTMAECHEEAAAGAAYFAIQ